MIENICHDIQKSLMVAMANNYNVKLTMESQQSELYHIEYNELKIKVKVNTIVKLTMNIKKNNLPSP
jgi:hypothetical protein